MDGKTPIDGSEAGCTHSSDPLPRDRAFTLSRTRMAPQEKVAPRPQPNLSDGMKHGLVIQQVHDVSGGVHHPGETDESLAASCSNGSLYNVLP